MRNYLLVVALMFILNIACTGLLQSRIRVIGNQINAIENSRDALQTKNAFLEREKQDLVKRERIVSYAQTNLGMKVLKPDEIADGKIIKEITEDTAKNNNVIYSFIDFITPSLNAFETR